MTIRFDRLLYQWHPRKDECDWVLCTISQTQRSTYRKAGAMMLFNSLGQQYGMLSGGCLEGDLLRHARKALMADRAITVDYDMRDDSEERWQQAIGCGGAVSVLLQPINASNHYLGLDKIFAHLEQGHQAIYRQRLDPPGLGAEHWQCQPLISEGTTPHPTIKASQHISDANGRWLVTHIKCAPHLAIFGGGIDAIPLANIAHEMGWSVSVIDGRVGYAKTQHFPHADIIDERPDTLQKNMLRRAIDAAVLMNHNINLDAQALRFLHDTKAAYIGILGPAHRRHKVEALAGLTEHDFGQFYAGPAGIDIGATLPETIALSIMAQCHQVVEAQQKLGSTRNIMSLK